MTSNINLTRVIVILLFAMSFTLIGWLAPAVYATYVPDNAVIESHGFEAQNTTTSADGHYICFDRTVHHASTARVFTELYLVSDDNPDVRTEIDSDVHTAYMQSGRSEIITRLSLPDNLQAGDYRYLLIIKMQMADERVTRDFTFTSERFTISENGEPEPMPSPGMDPC